MYVKHEKEQTTVYINPTTLEAASPERRAELEAQARNAAGLSRAPNRRDRRARAKSAVNVYKRDPRKQAARG